MGRKNTTHDSFIRAILADKDIAAEYFGNYLPPFVRQHLDFSSLVQLPDTYLSEELQKTMSDIVYTCRKNDGTGEIKACLLIEHKSYPDKYTPVQIGGYIFSALQKQAANKEPLSIVIPVLLYHGKGKWQYRTLASLFENLEEGWEKFLPGFAYIYNNLGELTDEQVKALSNKFLAASLLVLKHTFEKEWLALNASRMLVLTENASESLQKNFIVYLFNRSDLKDTEIMDMFERLSLSSGVKDFAMNTWGRFIEKGKKEGVEEGIKKGLEKGKTEVVRNLLSQTDFTIAKIANLANVTEAFVQKVKNML